MTERPQWDIDGHCTLTPIKALKPYALKLELLSAGRVRENSNPPLLRETQRKSPLDSKLAQARNPERLCPKP